MKGEDDTVRYLQSVLFQAFRHRLMNTMEDKINFALMEYELRVYLPALGIVLRPELGRSHSFHLFKQGAEISLVSETRLL